jgi:hypothetical protein
VILRRGVALVFFSSIRTLLKSGGG